MEEIKILFLMLGTLFGNNESRIIADNATVIINPLSKTIEIRQVDLFTVLIQPEDSLKVSNELKEIEGKTISWRPELEKYPVKNYQLTSGDDGTLHAKILLQYNSHKDLEDYGFAINDGYFLYRDFPGDHLQTDDGQRKDGFWYFSAYKPFTFSQKSPRMPGNFRAHKRRFLSMWGKNNPKTNGF